MVKAFPLSPLDRILRKAGAERVSATATEELRNVLLEVSDEVALDAIAAARHADRVTVKREDILLATR